MHLPNRAGARRRTRRALLGAAMTAALAAVAVPAAAQAATVELSADGTTLIHRGAGGENNSLNVRVVDGAVEVKDFAGLSSRTPLCVSVSSGTVRCAIGVPTRLHSLLGDRNDSTSIRVGIPVIVEGGAGDDSFSAGNGPDPSNVAYHGGFGRDTVTYRFADRGVRVNASSFFTADGRKNFDRDNVMDDVELIHGSEFDDELVDFTLDADIGPKTLVGRQGNDVLRSGLGDHGVGFDMGSARDGADTVVAGHPDFTLVDYSKRTQPLTVTLDHGTGNDGEPGEGDTITGPVAQVVGGQAGDVIRAQPGSTDGTFILGGPGGDTLEGADGGDDLRGDGGVDTLLGNGGSDILHARDGLTGEIVGCGTGIDSAILDPGDGHTSCENRTVGVLRLTPRTVRAQAGEPVRLSLGWRHPRAWQQLRSIELRLVGRGVPVGRVTIRPRAKRISGDGAVQLVRKQTRLTREAKTVTARLAVRLDANLAGQTLRAEVEATDRRGARQLERAAGTVRVVG